MNTYELSDNEAQAIITFIKSYAEHHDMNALSLGERSSLFNAVEDLGGTVDPNAFDVE